MDSLKESLRRYWGYSSFRPQQEEAVRAILERRDSLSVLPTGGGKSLCYQLPSIHMNGLTLVVSPLISLMKDQVDSLRAMGIDARRWTSDMDGREARETLSAIQSGALKLLYVSPERMVQPEFIARFSAAPLNFLAVDEAHCISHWGHDFRPEYRQLAEVRRALNIPCHAYTATATPRVRKDIAEQLGLRSPALIVGSFDRPNLSYHFARRARPAVEEALAAVKRHPGEAGIIYCITRRAVEELAGSLCARGVEARGYHAGMAPEDRTNVQDDFMNERCNIIVATVAFGMGVDRPDVRFVLHAGLPKSVEHYQQESGRAGRDGLPAECLLYYNYEDFRKWQFIFEKAAEEQEERTPAPGDLPKSEITKIALKLAREMYDFAEGFDCRHRHLVEYFGQKYEKNDCAACDICLKEREELTDARTMALKILSAVVRTGQNFGGQYVAETLKGAVNERIRANEHDKLSTFGLLASETLPVIRSYIEQLEAQGLLERSADSYSVYRVTPRGWSLLRQRDLPVRLILPPKTKPKKQKEAKGFREAYLQQQEAPPELFEKLRKVRIEVARKASLPPFIIAHDKMLQALASNQPQTIQELLLIPGFGLRKAEQYGQPFLECIKKWRSR